MSQINQRLTTLGITLPDAPAPAANYLPATHMDGIVYLSGQTPKQGTELLYRGKIGTDLSVDQGYAAAQVCTLRLLSALQAIAGDLDRVQSILKISVFVNADSDFTQHPQVANGVSDLLEKIFGDIGMHARAAIGASSLPGNAAVEVDMIVKLYPD